MPHSNMHAIVNSSAASNTATSDSVYINTTSPLGVGYTSNNYGYISNNYNYGYGSNLSNFAFLGDGVVVDDEYPILNNDKMYDPKDGEIVG